VPPGFTESIVLSGLTNPTVVRFASDGRVFVAEKSGLIKVFDDLSDPTPSVFADLRENVYNFWDRGLLGMELDPSFPSRPYVYVLYTYDHVLGDPSPPPKWGTHPAGQEPPTSDPCPTPPGPMTDGCVVSGRLSRLQAAGNVMTGSEKVLVEDWCQQFPSHSIGTVAFGPDGALYASGGDGASFAYADYGQSGDPPNPCGDPPGAVGSVLTPPTAEGGALRSQDLRTSGDPVSLSGSVIRVDPATGAGLPTNPLSASADANARRIIAYGLRNPFRVAFRPGTSELWIGDVGQVTWEEINRISAATDAIVENFGWPCYEGPGRYSGYDVVDLAICENLYRDGIDTKPFFAYHHDNQVVPGEACRTGSSSISGLSFEFAPNGSSLPPAYQGGLFFADYSRDCIWVMKKGVNGVPAPGLIETFIADAANPVNLAFGPGGDLYYVDLDGGTIRRIHYGPPPPPPAGLSYVSDLSWWSMTNGWGPVEKDNSNGDVAAGDGSTLALDGVTYAKGLGAHAASELRYNLAGDCTRFTASVGVDDEVGAAGSVAFQVYADAAEVYDSGVMTGASWTKNIDVSVAGANELRLVLTDGGDNINSDHGDWASARIECGSATGTVPGGYLSDLAWTSMTNGWGPVEKDKSNGDLAAGDGAPLTLQGVTHAKGLGAHAASEIRYDLRGGCSRFTASVGVDDEVGAAGSVVFQVYADATKMYDSGPMTGASATKAVDVSVVGTNQLRLVVTDGGDNINSDHGDWASARIECGPSSTNQAPAPRVEAPAAAATWKVGDVIAFSGSASDPEDGQVPPAALTWSLTLHHCPSTCHTHLIQTFAGVVSGSFSAPDHDYPSYLELALSATDSRGATAVASVRLDPKTTTLSFATAPTGLDLNVDGVSSTAPFTRTVIVGSQNSLAAATPQTRDGATYAFASWSDGGPRTHNIVAPAAATTYTATYSAPPANTATPAISGQAREGKSLLASSGSWAGTEPMTFAYRWQRCQSTNGPCINLEATTSTYTPVAADVGSRLRATVTASNAVGSATATSAMTSAVKPR
jgi:glucose/arabinose dehydrogenase